MSESSCQICNGKAFTTCFACGIALCEKCSWYELIGSSCVGEIIIYYCPPCVQDLDKSQRRVAHD